MSQATLPTRSRSLQTFPFDEALEPAPQRRLRTLRVGVLGLGRVGQAVVQRCAANRELFARRGLEVRIVAALVRDPLKPRDCDMERTCVTADPVEFFSQRLDVVIEVLGGVSPAGRYVARLLRSGIPVITANKSLLAAHGPELIATAARHGTTLRAEASAIAGVPFLETLRRRPHAARVEKLAGILNGTSNYILTSLAEKRITLAEALQRAQQLGYAEPDPSFDLSGRDAAEKLAIILQHLGAGTITRSELEIRGVEDLTATDLRQAEALGGSIKPVASAALKEDGIEAFVGPAFVPFRHPLAQIDGAQNAIAFYSPEIGQLCFSGPGAGPDITAGTILDDLVEIGASPRPNAECGDVLADVVRGRGRPVTAPRTAWFVRIHLQNPETRFGDIPEFFQTRGVEVRQLLGAPPGSREQFLYVLTGVAERCVIETALQDLQTKTACDALAIRALEGCPEAPLGRCMR